MRQCAAVHQPRNTSTARMSRAAVRPPYVHHQDEQMHARRAHAQRLVAAHAHGCLQHARNTKAARMQRAAVCRRAPHEERMQARRAHVQQHARTAACSTRTTPTLHACRVQQCVAVHHHKERMQARRAHAQRLVAARALLAAGKLTRPAINRATPTLLNCTWR